ncbi:hypothetical protein FA95DRAFT_1150088 [Auriscalpium vulgare]|uniref:Uncharacterized protein n=1 Tax=Auriscalpium vulgare TaxID=40419 RepID=A0ACB8R3W2_9AGAM|nr:hypothetical protein FA95DRAFT_1150088 [Auriscalpium vulgare]
MAPARWANMREAGGRPEEGSRQVSTSSAPFPSTITLDWRLSLCPTLTELARLSPFFSAILLATSTVSTSIGTLS